MAGVNGQRGSRLNPKIASCFTEEDMIGQMMAISKGATHAGNLSKRIIQRWQLQFNAWLCEGAP